MKVKRLMIGVAVCALLASGALLVVAGCKGTNTAAREATLEAAPALPAVNGGDRVVADATVVPVQSATLSLPTGGIVAEVLVAEGDFVKTGQILVRLDDARLVTAVMEAEASLATAEAQLAKAKAGPGEEEVAVAEAAVEVARTGVQTTQGTVASARASLARAQTGATAEEIAIAERQVAQAKNALWEAQSQRDIACSQAGGSNCNSAQAAVGSAEEAVRIAELQLQQLQAGPRQEDIAVAQAQLQQALGELATAQAQVRQAEAKLARVKKRPSAEDIAIVRAQVEQAEAALEQAKVALAETELRAPFSGTVVTLDVNTGEYVAPGRTIVQLADLSAWQIETSDLTELDVVRIAVGQPAVVKVDALPGLELTGRVQRIALVAGDYRGDVTYSVTVELDGADHPGLRWGMAALVEIRTP